MHQTNDASHTRIKNGPLSYTKPLNTFTILVEPWLVSAVLAGKKGDLVNIKRVITVLWLIDAFLRNYLHQLSDLIESIL